MRPPSALIRQRVVTIKTVAQTPSEFRSASGACLFARLLSSHLCQHFKLFAAAGTISQDYHADDTLTNHDPLTNIEGWPRLRPALIKRFRPRSAYLQAQLFLVVSLSVMVHIVLPGGDCSDADPVRTEVSILPKSLRSVLLS